LGLIAVLFPNAFIIHCRRDPLDTCLSMYFNNMAGPQGYSFQLSDVGYWYRQYERLMEHWDKCLPLQILDIRYEELINNQEQSIHKLLEYLKLDWNDNCITFQNTNRTVLTASNWQVKQPLYNSSLYRWKNYEKYLDKLKEVLNYN
nr:sulfotransferase [Candidatus Dadabacteria bacterium]